jgi:hypothetical protein
VNSTETTPASAAGGRQVGQLLAGRYRLAMFKGGDDIADVWHALDESTEKVVTLEILRDRSNDVARQRFLAEAKRMAAIERPSVMRVAAIHNEAADTFIVFEHLIPLPVVLTGLTAVAKDSRPATRAAEEKAAADKAAAPSTLAAVAGPTRSAAAPEAGSVEAPQAIVDLAAPTPSTSPLAATPPLAAMPPLAVTPQLDAIVARLPGPLQEPMHAMSRSLTSATTEVTDLMDRATRFAADARLRLRDVRPGALIAAVRALVAERFDTRVVTSLAARVGAWTDRLSDTVSDVRGSLDALGALRVRRAQNPRVTADPHAASNARAMANARAASARDEGPTREAPQIGAALRTGASLVMRPATAAISLIARVLRKRLVIAAAALIVLAVVASRVPLDDAIAYVQRAIAGSPDGATKALAPAPFELPPLAAYGAVFESQGPYPTASPNATVDWVVALRNTGSAGWYRGIDGAQAALALPDGTGVAVQSTEYVAPGQVGWFIVHLKARAEPGTYTVTLLPRIDGRGPLPDLGIYAVVTVTKNP